MARGQKTGGRTKGTPNKATADVKAAAQEYTSEAIKTLADIMKSSESDAARVAACNAILDRGHGKPKQSLEASGPDGQSLVTIVELIAPKVD